MLISSFFFCFLKTVFPIPPRPHCKMPVGVWLLPLTHVKIPYTITSLNAFKPYRFIKLNTVSQLIYHMLWNLIYFLKTGVTNKHPSSYLWCHITIQASLVHKNPRSGSSSHYFPCISFSLTLLLPDFHHSEHLQCDPKIFLHVKCQFWKAEGSVPRTNPGRNKIRSACCIYHFNI